MSIYTDIGLTGTGTSSAAHAAAASSKLGSYNLTQADFLSLLTTELAYQDPTNPTDNKEMVSQLSQISTVNGITSLNETVNSLSSVVTSSQALMASGLVGHSVLIDSNTGYSSGTGFDGVVTTGDDGAKDLTITITSEAGEIVYQASAQGDYSGNVAFDWDGKDLNGNQLPGGYYKVSANGLVNGISTDIGARVYAKVSSVLVGSSASSTVLNLEGMGQYGINEVLEIGN